jgi:D-alanyl-D-alanine carboxypeptidase (penicillin-binding protein 5/6)
VTHTLDRSAFGPITLHPRYRRRRIVVVLAALVAAAVTAGAAVYLLDDSRRNYLTTNGWPQTGQGAYRFVGDQPAASADQHPVPIASVAKVMTAYLVIARYPLSAGSAGPSIRITAADAADTDDRRQQDQSIVAVRTGERLTERQALMALLLPSANNVAVMLARLVSGSVDAFVARMNKVARQLGMGDTTYTDPSGFDEGTVSTAKDQLRLAEVVAANDTLSRMMATPSYRLPVAGRVKNTDTLLGQDGFSGMKTGSDDAAGGCFMFRTKRLRDGHEVDLIGVVLGQPGHNLITAGLYAAKQLADSLAPAA